MANICLKWRAPPEIFTDVLSTLCIVCRTSYLYRYRPNNTNSYADLLITLYMLLTVVLLYVTSMMTYRRVVMLVILVVANFFSELRGESWKGESLMGSFWYHIWWRRRQDLFKGGALTLRGGGCSHHSHLVGSVMLARVSVGIVLPTCASPRLPPVTVTSRSADLINTPRTSYLHTHAMFVYIFALFIQ